MTKDDEKKKKEAGVEKEEPSAEGAALQAAAQKKEDLAGAVLVEAGQAEAPANGEKLEAAPDPGAIAEKYISAVPEEDRQITTPKQMEIVLGALEGTRPFSHLTTTVDKLGNLPVGILEAINATGGEDRQKAIDVARSFEKDPAQAAAQADKIRAIANSELPHTVKGAMLNIILAEGDKTAAQAFGEMAKRIESQADIPAIRIISELRDDENFISAEADNVRRAALKKFLAGVYPELMNKPEVILLDEIQNIPFEELREAETAMQVIEKAASIMGDTLLDERLRKRLGGASTMAEALAKTVEGKIKADDLAGNLTGILRKFIMGKVSAEKGPPANIAKQAKEVAADHPKESEAEKQEQTKVPIEQVSFMHVEDSTSISDIMAKELSEKFGMDRRQGAPQSVEAAKSLLEKIVEKGDPLQLVLLDKSFFQFDGDEVDSGRAWKNFMTDLEAMAKPGNALEKTIVAIVSGAIDEEELREIKARYPRIVAGLSKGSQDLPERVADLLANAGVVEKSEKVLEAQKAVAKAEAPARLKEEFKKQRIGATPGGLEAGGQDRPKLLQLVNEARANVDMPPLADESQGFAEIVALVEKTRGRAIYPELLFKEE